MSARGCRGRSPPALAVPSPLPSSRRPDVLARVARPPSESSRLLRPQVHHPSAQGGSADYLNRIALALAHDHGVPVIDMAPTTLQLTAHDTQRSMPCIYQLSDGLPKPYNERVGQCTGLGNIDVQHGVDAATLVGVVLAGVREHCGNRSASAIEPL